MLFRAEGEGFGVVGLCSEAVVGFGIVADADKLSHMVGIGDGGVGVSCSFGGIGCLN
jgi:hypothetical protein